jgi:hypothetical protein
MANSTLVEARRVKDKVAGIARAAGPIVGVGLAKVGDSYAVKVNFREPQSIGGRLPDSVDGVPVIYEVAGRITSRNV